MKMKNLLIGGMSLALVACISVGATLAYLTAQTKEVKNVFTASASIAMTLDEAQVKLSDDGTQYVKDESKGRVQGDGVNNTLEYKDILPGVVQYKDPTIHVTSVPAAGADIYACVKNLTGTGYTATVNMSGWTKVDGYTDLYKYNQTVKPDNITGDPKECTIPVFNGITFDWQNGAAVSNIDVKVSAYAIQTGVDNANELAANALGATKN